jgi:hypothetical protein
MTTSHFQSIPNFITLIADKRNIKVKGIDRDPQLEQFKSSLGSDCSASAKCSGVVSCAPTKSMITFLFSLVSLPASAFYRRSLDLTFKPET